MHPNTRIIYNSATSQHIQHDQSTLHVTYIAPLHSTTRATERAHKGTNLSPLPLKVLKLQWHVNVLMIYVQAKKGTFGTVFRLLNPGVRICGQ